jgi:hypothetical protein
MCLDAISVTVVNLYRIVSEILNKQQDIFEGTLPQAREVPIFSVVGHSTRNMYMCKPHALFTDSSGRVEIVSCSEFWSFSTNTRQSSTE